MGIISSNLPEGHKESPLTHEAVGIRTQRLSNSSQGRYILKQLARRIRKKNFVTRSPRCPTRTEGNQRTEDSDEYGGKVKIKAEKNIYEYENRHITEL